MSTDTNDIVSGGLFAPIEPLKLNDTFYTWYTTTNEIIDALNPLAIYDVSGGPGITVTKIADGTAVVSIASGCGLRFDNNISLTLDISGTQETSTVESEDYYIFEKYDGTNITTDSADCESLYKIQATNILPYVVSGDHDFVGGDASLFLVSAVNFNIESTFVEFKATNVVLNNNPDATTDGDYDLRENLTFVGFTVRASDENPTLGYDGSLLAWTSNQNFSVTSDRSFVSDSATTDAVFNFSTKTASQDDVFVKLLTGIRTSDDDIGAVFGIHANDSINKLSFTYEDETSTEGQVNLFTARYNEGASQTEFEIDGKIYVRDIEDSSQFLTVSDSTPYKVPLTNTNGVLDHKFTNRFVTENYDPTLSAGDVVTFIYNDNTETTEDIYVTGAQADSETNAKVVGVVEQIAGGKITVALNGVCNYTGATSGQVYYLSQATAGAVVTTKPASGIVKEVFVGIDDTSILVFSSSNLQTQNFGIIDVDGVDTINASTYGDTLSIVAGSNISLSVNTDNELVIAAGSLVDADYFKTVNADSGSVVATISDDTINILGDNGITTTGSSSTLTVSAPNSYGTIEIVGENTDELDYTLTASSGSDTLVIRSGTGINITSDTNNDIIIEAIGVSVPAAGSVGNTELASMPAYAIKASQGDGTPTDVYQTDYPLAAYYTVTTDTDGDAIFVDPDTLNWYYPLTSTVLGSVVASTTPDEIAGYVFGRVVDELGNVSEIKALDRAELRLLLGASPDGYLEENNKLFNSWELFDSTDLINNTASATAQGKSGVLKLVGGPGVSLNSVTAGGTDAVQIDVTGDIAAFATITNQTTGESLVASTVGSTLYITEGNAVGWDITTGDGIEIYIKSGSITNDLLDPMSENTVKVRTAGTDSTGPEDLYIGEDQMLGRISGGEVASLTATQVRTLLGFTSADYFKEVECYTGITLEGTVSASSTEKLTIKGGTNVSLDIDGSSIVINATTDDAVNGIKTVSFTESGVLYRPTHFVFDETYLTSPSGLYNNIEIMPVMDETTDTLTLSLDLGLMPQKSIKAASGSYNSSRGGYLATNLVIQEGHVAGVVSGGSGVSSIPFSAVVANSGLNYFNTISANGSIISSSGASNISLVSEGDATLTVLGSTIKIGAYSTLQSDDDPTLGGNLDLNGYYLNNGDKKSLYVSNNLLLSSNHYLNILNDTSKIEFKALRDTSTASSIDLVLTPYGTGSVVSTTFSSNISNNLKLKTGTSDGKIYVDGNAANYTIISSLASKNLYLSPGTSSTDVTFYFDNGSTAQKLTTRRNGNDTALIHSNSTGNMILVAGYTGSTISTGSSYIDIYSDIRMHSSKQITSSDNIIKINTTDTGYLKLVGTTNSNIQQVYSDTLNTGVSRAIDVYTVSTVGKAVKYLVRGESTSSSKDSFLLEFNVITSGIDTQYDIISRIYTSAALETTKNVVPSVSSNGSKVTVSLNTISGTYNLTVYRTSIT